MRQKKTFSIKLDGFLAFFIKFNENCGKCHRLVRFSIFQLFEALTKIWGCRFY